MLYILIPLAAIIFVGILCLDVKIGFILGDAFEKSGFGFGIYMMTVLGLIAIEISVFVFFFNLFRGTI